MTPRTQGSQPSTELVVAAWVGEKPILVAEVLRREDLLRAGQLATRLPGQGSPQGRNVRRWIVQLMASEEIVLAEAKARGLVPPPDAVGRALDVGTALQLGGVLATVLRTVPVAAAVRDAVSADVAIHRDTARAYYDSNPDLFPPTVDKGFDELEAGLVHQLREHERDRCFAAWVHRQQRTLVRLMPGYEHPGDPHQADATHRH